MTFYDPLSPSKTSMTFYDYQLTSPKLMSGPLLILKNCDFFFALVKTRAEDACPGFLLINKRDLKSLDNDEIVALRAIH